ncbi:MAG: hypothetical protein IJ537_05910 [Bacteroidaceae bacterium]|nr:hypothetical protein [Bacteroidaceae bacterium]
MITVYPCPVYLISPNHNRWNICEDAKQLAETEASRKHNCDRLIDPRFDFLRKGKRILRITVDGRPGNYRTRDEKQK